MSSTGFPSIYLPFLLELVFKNIFLISITISFILGEAAHQSSLDAEDARLERTIFILQHW